jgi:hypothetical protein
MEDCDSKSARANSSPRPYIEKPLTKIELVEWLNVKALSSSPSTAKKKNLSMTVKIMFTSQIIIGKHRFIKHSFDIVAIISKCL